MKDNIKITVFTATYNRRDLLPRLYESLLRQRIIDFEWVIVDDGSVDDTDLLVKSWIEENKISIKYHRQENSGKHKAINRGLDIANGEFFFIVDSDDYITDDSLLQISEYSNAKDFSNFDGYVFRKAYNENSKIGTEFPMFEFVSNHLEKVYKYKLKGDLAEVVKTKILRKCKFNDDINEKFCAESLMWNRASKLGSKYLFVDKIIYIAEYLTDGLSSSVVRNRRNSPEFATLLYKELAETPQLPLYFKIRAYVNFWRYSFFNRKNLRDNLIFINWNFWGVISIFPGLIVRVIDDIAEK